MEIKYFEHNNNYFIKAFNNETIIGNIIIDTNCLEYPRYKEYCNGNKLVKIVRVETNPNYVGQGIATKLIKNTIDKYKEYNLILLCSPQKRIENTDTLKTVADLQIFYSKFGFIKTDELLPTMIRKANIR